MTRRDWWLGIFGMIVSVAALLSAQQQAPRQPATLTPARSGRFQIVFGPFARADVYLLDTDTGRVWRPVTYTNVVGEPEVWQSQDRIDSKTQQSEWENNQTYKPKANH